MEKIRIWPTTYLYALDSFEKSELVHAERITFYPDWTDAIHGYYTFTLVFKRLSKNCKIFDLVEEVKEGTNPFIVRNIVRNSKDIYYFNLQ